MTNEEKVNQLKELAENLRFFARYVAGNESIKKFAEDTREIITNKVDFTVDYSVCTSPEMQERLEENAKDKKEYNTQNIDDVCDDIMVEYTTAYTRIRYFSNLNSIIEHLPADVRDEYIDRNVTLQNADIEKNLLGSLIGSIRGIKLGKGI